MTKGAPLMVSSWWPRESQPHAAPFIVDHALAVQAAVGAVECLSIEPGLRRRSDRPIAGPLPIKQVSVRVPWRVTLSSAGPAILYRAGQLAGRRLQQSPRAIVVQNVEHAGPYAAGLASVTGSSLLYLEHWTAVALGELTEVQRRSVEMVMASADVPLAVSENLSHALDAIAGLQPGTTRIIDNPVDQRVFTATPPIPHDGVHIVQVADFRPVKDHNLLIDGLLALGPEIDRMNLRFTLVGEGPERAAVEGRLAGTAVEHRVEFTGKLSRPELADRVRHADWTLLTSRMENAPCVVAESLSIGRPVIAPRIGGIEGMVGEGDGVLYDRTVDGLLGALRQAAQPNGESWRRRAEAAARRWAPQAVAESWLRYIGS